MTSMSPGDRNGLFESYAVTIKQTPDPALGNTQPMGHFQIRSQFGQGDIWRRVDQSQDFICMGFHPP